MSHEPEPIVIDRRHPAWVAAFQVCLRSLWESCDVVGKDGMNLALDIGDAAWRGVQARDIAERAAYDQWKREKDARRRDDFEPLAKAMFGKTYGNLAGDLRQTVSYTLAQHGDDLQKAIASLADDFDPLADIPCPSKPEVTP